jgi:hypothetical protein
MFLSPLYLTAVKVYFTADIFCFNVLKNKPSYIIYSEQNYPQRSLESANIIYILNFNVSTYFLYVIDLKMANNEGRNMSS